jgi:hypothetical protein
MKRYSVAVLLLTFGMTSLSRAASAASNHKAIFKGGASSTGWVDFDFQDGKRIFIPAKINRHATKVLLATGLPISDIDKAFAASIGLQPQADFNASGTKGDDRSALIHGLKIQIGNMTLSDTVASPMDFAPLAKHMGHSLPLLLGDDAFNELAVDSLFNRPDVSNSSYNGLERA